MAISSYVNDGRPSSSPHLIRRYHRKTTIGHHVAYIKVNRILTCILLSKTSRKCPIQLRTPIYVCFRGSNGDVWGKLIGRLI